MDFNYYNYVISNKKYYEPFKITDIDYKLKSIPSDWIISKGSHWVMAIKKNYVLQDQGWKLHISVNAKDAQDCLYDVSKYLFEKCVPFKFVKSQFELENKNSKYGDRSASGKFITIYPKDIDLKCIIMDLEVIVSKYDKGPYILTDMRWNNSNVYYRYGGFVEKYLKNGLLAIEDNLGNLIEDDRSPFYTVPNFVIKPDFLEKNEMNLELSTKLDDYEIDGAVHFSNGGGVYIANYNGEKVILKEARPNAGIDGVHKDAVYRLKKEFYYLEKLNDSNVTPKFYDYFNAWEHYFLAMEYLDSINIGSWSAINYPFNRNIPDNIDRYFSDLYILAEKCCEGLEKIHSYGIAHGDIQPKNIMILEENNSLDIRFIDFETACNLNGKAELSLGTPGFFENVDNNSFKDWIALFRVFKSLIVPIAPLEIIVSDVFDVQYKWISSEFGNIATSILDLIVDTAKKYGFDILKSYERPFSMSYDIDINEKIICNSIVSVINKDNDRFIPGDIKQYELKNGMYSFGYGASGILYLLYKSKYDISDILIDFTNKFKSNMNLYFEDIGLISGLSGIAATLNLLGEENLANLIFDEVLNDNTLIKKSNISIESGLSGVGLSLLDMYVETNDVKYLDKAIEFHEKIEFIFNNNSELIFSLNNTVSSDGLLYGWSGASIFSIALYNVTKNSRYVDCAKSFLDYEIAKLEYTDGLVLLKTKDDKHMPYFSVGSAGLTIPLILMKNLYDDKFFEGFLDKVTNTVTARPCVNSGFFEGFIGLLYICKIIDEYKGSNYYEELYKDIYLYILRDNDLNTIVIPGIYGYRVSYDLATGLGGLLFCERKDLNILSFLPIKNYKVLFRELSNKKYRINTN